MTQNQGNNDFPAWSRDGSKIAFTSDRDGQPEVYVMNTDGSGLTRLTYSGGDQNHNYDGMPTWSPDGSQIAFTSNRTGGYRIWVMNADGSNPHQLSTQPYSFHPQWSPDGRSILFDAAIVVNSYAWQRLYVTSLDGSTVTYRPEQHRDTDNSDLDATGWSPDGKYIYFTTVYWVFYQNQWYWTQSFNAYDFANITVSYPSNLTPGNLEWYPSWETYTTQAPATSFNSLLAVTPNPFTVTWDAQNTTSYFVTMDIQYRDGNGPWQDLKTNTYPGSSYTFDGTGGHTYGFRARARDVFFNQSPWPASPQLVTTVEAMAPHTSLAAAPPFTLGSSITLSWSGVDPGGSGISSYDFQFREATSPTWNDVLTNSSYQGYTVSGQIGKTYYFRVRATDKAHNQENWSGTPTNNTSTTFYSSAVNGVLHDASGNPVSGMIPTFTIPPFFNLPSGLDGSYAAYFTTSPIEQAATWSKTGYDALPPAYLKLTQDQKVDVYLPPATNAVSNGDFENASLSPADWTSSGEIPPALTTSQAHSGHQSISFGVSSSFEPSTTLVSIFTDATVDNFGVTHVVQSFGGPHVYSQLKPDDTWTPPKTIPGFGDNCWFVKLMVDSQHNVQLFFTNANQQLIYTRRAIDGTWSTPEALPIYNDAPSLAIDADDHMHLSWFNGTDLYYMEWVAGTWSPAQSVTNGSPQGYFSMSVGPKDEVNLLILGPNNSLLYSQKTGSISWSAPINIFSQPFNPTIESISAVIDKSGQTHVILLSGDNRQYHLNYVIRSVDGSWSSPLEIMEYLNEGYIYPQVKVSPDNTFYVFFDQDTGPGGPSQSIPYAPFYMKRNLDGSWSLPIRIPGINDYVLLSNLAVEIDSNNLVHFSWSVNPADHDAPFATTREVYYEWMDPAGNTSLPLLADRTVVNNLTEQVKQIRIGQDGSIYVVYADGNYSHAYLSQLVGHKVTGGSTLSQSIQVPPLSSHAGLSFLYLFSGSPTPQNNFTLQVTSVAETTTLFSSGQSTDGWVHQWIDLSSYAGLTVTLTYSLYNLVGYPATSVYLDEVSVGSTHPDAWVKTGPGLDVLPESQVIIPIIFGNQGQVPAPGSQLTLTLPASLIFVKASIAPSATSPTITWDLGDLSPQSGPITVLVTVQVAADAPRLTPLVYSLSITDGGELETANNTSSGQVVIRLKTYLPVMMK